MYYFALKQKASKTEKISVAVMRPDSAFARMRAGKTGKRTSQPLAIAKPPPSRRIMFHGMHS